MRTLAGLGDEKARRALAMRARSNRTADEFDLLFHMDRLEGRPLTPEEEHLSLIQAEMMEML